MAQIIREHSNTALEFLEALSPLNGFFPADYRHAYIFRGAGSADYRLVPSAFRSGAILRSYQDSVQVPLPTLKEQIRAELTTLWEFFVAADRQGLRLPEDSQDLREVFRVYVSVRDDLFKAIEAGKIPWPPNHLISLMALAQHYGVPTRLLDWTRSPYIAAYFAASSATPQTANMCVWAFAEVNSEVQEILTDTKERRLLLVSAPASDNENLRAQRWVGLLYRHIGSPMQAPLAHSSYDELADDSFGITPIFWKLTLPTSETGELLRLLAALDINASTVFPGFSGAARAVNEMSHWTRQAEFRGATQRTKIYWGKNEALFKRHHLNDAQ